MKMAHPEPLWLTAGWLRAELGALLACRYPMPLQSLQLSLYGYRVQHAGAPAFSLRRPPWWRRSILLQAAPLLELRVAAAPDGVHVYIVPAAGAHAQRGAYIGRTDILIGLDEALQQQLLHGHAQAQQRAPSIVHRLWQAVRNRHGAAASQP